jgi:hypothetical protein
MAGPHAYTPARRKPTRAEVPSPVVNALRLMYTGLAATVLTIILGAVDVAHLDTLQKQNQYYDVVAYNHETSSIAIISVFAFVGGIIGVVGWILSASAVRRGRKWGAVVGTVFFGLDLACMLTVLSGAYEAPASKIMSLLVWGIGLVAVILLWQAQSRAFYRAFR